MRERQFLRMNAAFVVAFTSSLTGTAPARAHIELSQTSFPAGVNFAAFFKVGHGCDDAPTTSLTVEIPEGVEVLTFPGKPGWTLEIRRARGAQPVGWRGGAVTGAVHSVTWKGRLKAKANDQFGLFLKLPARAGAVDLPTVQACETGENRWVEIPAPGAAWNSVPKPAPVLTLIAAAQTAFASGAIRVEQPWTRATPPGAQTAVGYMRVLNRGTATDTLTGTTSDAAARVEIHSTTNVNGVASMRGLADGIALAPGMALEMAPNGTLHLMLVGLKAPLLAGQKIPLTLQFAAAGALRVELTVEAIGALSPNPAPAGEHAHH